MTCNGSRCHFCSLRSASADVLALAAVEADISSIAPGTGITIKWRGKPVFIRHRTAAEIAVEEAVNVSGLRDAETDAVRVQNPAYLVVIGICTHLGCVPVGDAVRAGARSRRVAWGRHVVTGADDASCLRFFMLSNPLESR